MKYFLWLRFPWLVIWLSSYFFFCQVISSCWITNYVFDYQYHQENQRQLISQLCQGTGISLYYNLTDIPFQHCLTAWSLLVGGKHFAWILVPGSTGYSSYDPAISNEQTKYFNLRDLPKFNLIFSDPFPS